MRTAVRILDLNLKNQLESPDLVEKKIFNPTPQKVPAPPSPFETKTWLSDTAACLQFSQEKLN